MKVSDGHETSWSSCQDHYLITKWRCTSTSWRQMNFVIPDFWCWQGWKAVVWMGILHDVWWFWMMFDDIGWCWMIFDGFHWFRMTLDDVLWFWMIMLIHCGYPLCPLTTTNHPPWTDATHGSNGKTLAGGQSQVLPWSQNRAHCRKGCCCLDLSTDSNECCLRTYSTWKLWSNQG